MNKLQHTLDQISKNYTETKGFEYRLLKYKQLEVTKFCSGKCAIDIGCGVGILTQRLAPLFQSLVGIDGSPQKILYAQKNNQSPNIIYKCVLFKDFRPDCQFDTIIMTNVLEHIRNRFQFLNHIKKWLSPKGRIIVTVPNAKALHKRLGKEMGLIKNFYSLTPADKAKGHTKVYDSNRLSQEFTRAGLRVIHNRGFFLKPFSSEQMAVYDDKILDGLYELGKKYPDLCSSLIIVGTKP